VCDVDGVSHPYLVREEERGRGEGRSPTTAPMDPERGLAWRIERSSTMIGWRGELNGGFGEDGVLKV